jgi:hypothetical protein
MPIALVALLAFMASGPWREVAPGVEVARFTPSRAAPVINVVRVDPRRNRFSLQSAKLQGLSRPPTAAEWIAKSGAYGVINASMYAKDERTSVGYMRDGERVNNGGWSREKAVFVAEPSRAGLPEARILDRTCDPVGRLAPRYRVVVQSIRMLDCQGRNVWTDQPSQWGTTAIGTDRSGSVLLVHVAGPHSRWALRASCTWRAAGRPRCAWSSAARPSWTRRAGAAWPRSCWATRARPPGCPT